MGEDRLKKFLKETNMPKVAIARMCAIQQADISNYISGRINFSEQKQEKIMQAILVLEEQESSRIERLMRKSNTHN